MKTLNTIFAAVAITTALGFSQVTAQDNETPFSLMAHVNGVGQDKLKVWLSVQMEAFILLWNMQPMLPFSIIAL